MPFKMAIKVMAIQCTRCFVAWSLCWRHTVGGIFAEKKKTDIAKINKSLETCLEHNNWSPTYKLTYIYIIVFNWCFHGT